MSDLLFIFFSVVLFVSVILSPLMLVTFSIIYHQRKLDYLKLHSFLLVYYFTIVPIIYFFPSLFIIKSDFIDIIAIICFSVIYFLPLVFLIFKYILNLYGLLSFVNLFFVFNFLQAAILYFIFNLLN